MSIVIPVRGSTSTVEIFNDELPDVSTDVINLFMAILEIMNSQEQRR